MGHGHGSNETRNKARAAIQSSVPADQWKKNKAFSDEVKSMIMSHRLIEHPLIKSMNDVKMPAAIAKITHLEFGVAFAQVFTDSIVRAMYECSSLEKRFGHLAKVSARFLLELNLLDELGFQPGDKDAGEYLGDPMKAHYVEFVATVRKIGVTDEERTNYKASAAAIACRKSFEDQYSDYVLLTGVLAVAEQVFTKFAGPWARNTSMASGLDVSSGYHAIHVEDDDGEFLDDYHSEDSWFLFSQAMDPSRNEELKKKIVAWLDTWASFCDHIGMTAQKLMSS